MSSTTNVQALLPYVLRPVYTFSNGAFTTRVTLSNIDQFYANTATFSALNVGDTSGNVYLGSNSGNSAAIVASCNAASNTAIGILAANALSNSTNSEFFGYQTGGGGQNIQFSVLLGVSAGYRSSNILNSIFIGTSNSIQLSNVSNTISIGQTAGGTGNSNIYIGRSTGSNMTGSGNMFIGHGVNTTTFPVSSGLSATSSNKLAVGSSNSILIGGDFSNGVVAIGTTNTNALTTDGRAINSVANNGYGFLALDVANWTRIGQGLTIGIDPQIGLSSTGKFELDVNGHFRVQDGFGQLSFSNYYSGIQSNTVLTLEKIGSGGSGTTTLDVRGSIVASNITLSNAVQSAGYYTIQGSFAASGDSSRLIPIALRPGLLVGTILENGNSNFYSASGVLVTATSVPTLSNVATSGSLGGTTLTFLVNATVGNITISNAGSVSRTIQYNFTLYPVN
jgi:hypothetical protein